MKAFFERYGTVEEVSMPNRGDVNETLFHVNVLYQTKEQAAKAIAQAVKDEK